MTMIDIFNGDADGICALTQIRNANPTDSRLVTGVKRDIALVAKAGIEVGDRVTVLDISLAKNRDAVVEALALGVEIFYADHHDPGEIPDDPRLTALIDTAPDVCTSILVDLHLKGLKAIGAEIEIEDGYVNIKGPVRGGTVYLGGNYGSTQDIRALFRAAVTPWAWTSKAARGSTWRST